MSLNRKLTPLIAGRTIASDHYQDGALDIYFTDGSHIRIKSPASVELGQYHGRALKTIRQKDTSMYMDFSDDTTLELLLAEAMSSVMLRDKDGVMEYAD